MEYKLLTTTLKDRAINLLTDLGFNSDILKLSEVVEITKFTSKERRVYIQSLKDYRDIKNAVDTSREEGIAEGMEKGITKRNLEIAKEMKSDNESIEKIMKYTGLNRQIIESL